MAPQLETTTDVMYGTAEKVRSVNDSIQGRLATLRGQVADAEGAWRGAARNTFDPLMVRWESEAKRLNAALLAIADALRSNSAGYEAAQDSHVAQLNQVGGALAPF